MSDGGGFFCARFFRDDVERGLFKGWRESAWVELARIADYKTGEVRLTTREMAVRWDTSMGSVERWLAELGTKNVRMERIGATSREGRRIIIVDIEERSLRASDPDWHKERHKDGTNNGTMDGTKKTSNGAGKRHAVGTKIGTTDGTKAAQDLAHVQRIVPNEELLTVPTVPCTPGGGDLFGEPTAERPPVAPSEPEPEKASVVARRVVAVFHELSKARGGNGVSGATWAAQQKMAENALKTILSEQEATDALRWGMGEEFWRQRLRGHQMKVLIDVWSAWIEQTGGASNGRNGNGRNGNGHAGGEVGAGEGAGRGEIVLNNGRWERR